MRQVIYAWNYLEWGGAQVHILALIKEVRKEFSVAVVIPRESDKQFIKFLTDLNVRLEYFDFANVMSPPKSVSEWLSRRIRKIRSEYAMLKAIERLNLSDTVVHIDLLPHSSLLALSWLAMRTNVFITSHNALPPVSRVRELNWKLKSKIISRFPTFHVFCSNEHAKAYFSQHYSAQLADRIEITYTSINPDDVDRVLAAPGHREKLRKTFGIGDDGLVVLAVGNFIDRKGRWVFLDAAKRIVDSKQRERVSFFWLTPALPPENDLRRVESYELGDRFRLIESTEVGNGREDILRFYLIADIFALPSFVEGLPIALLEAMATGLPSISTNVYGIPEAVHNDETGLLIPPGDVISLADAIDRLCAGETLRLRIGNAGRQHVLKFFDERDAARKAVAAYKRAFST